MNLTAYKQPIKFSLTLTFIIAFFLSSSNVSAQFITTWKTTTAGESITIPTYSTETYNYTVDWGDGNITTGETGDATHAYAITGDHTVSITGLFPRIYFYSSSDPNKEKIISIDKWGNNLWASMAWAFYECINLAGQASDNPNLTNVKSMQSMFYGCSTFNQNIGGWVTSNVNSMANLFTLCVIFDQNIGSWDTAKVTDMSGMFLLAKKFHQDLPWETREVKNMRSMFSNAKNFNGNITNWDVENVQDMEYMFQKTDLFDQPIGAWTTTALTKMNGMFNDAIAFDKNIGNWNITGVSEMKYVFRGASRFNQDFLNWDFSNVTNTDSMFRDCIAFDQDLSNLDVSNVDYMSDMFNGATNFNGNIDNWDVSKVTNMNIMFADAINFNRDIGGWTTTSLQKTAYMFEGATIFDKDLNDWEVGSVTTMFRMFKDAVAFTKDLNGWDVSSVQSMEQMFDGATNFDGNISNWVTTSVTNMEAMFRDATAFSKNIEGWKTERVTNMGYMFDGAVNFDQNLENWNVEGLTATGISKGARNMFDGVTLSTINYEKLLISWAAQNVNAGVLFSGGNSTYCSPASITAHTTLESKWIITDGGNTGCTAVAQTYVPDDNFEQALIDLGYDSGPLDDYVLTANINTLTSLTVSNKAIADLTGIEDFLALTQLICRDNLLTSLDVSNNTALTNIDCSKNDITSLDLSTNISLTDIDCNQNYNLTSLNISQNNQVTDLDCYYNNLTTLDVSHMSNLNWFSIHNNPSLTNVNVTGLLNLTKFWCHSGDLSTIDITTNTALEIFSCGDNPLGIINLTQNTALKQLWAYKNGLTSLDLSQNPLLETLECNNNSGLSLLDFSNNLQLQKLNCQNTDITNLDLSTQNIFIELFGGNNPELTSLNIKNGNNTNVTTFNTNNTPKLTCIFVDDKAFSTTNWTTIDATSNFATTQAECDALSCSVPQSERDALMALYNNLDGANWTDNTNWNTAAPVEDWFGVTVDCPNNTVTEINLTQSQFVGNNLTGILPAKIKDLTNLNVLDLSHNQISGTIIPEIYDLTKLEILELNDNLLTGGISTDVDKLGNLQRFLLRNNPNLGGSIPAEFGNMATNLASISISNCGLTGQIPEELWNLNILRVLNLSDNNLDGNIPATNITNLTELLSLFLGQNNLDGSIPAGLALLPNLDVFHINNNQFTGVIPNFTGITTQLLIDNNKFQFGDFENEFNSYTANISLFRDSPQAKVDALETRNRNIGDNTTMVTNCSGSQNNYQWYKDGALISGATNATLSLTNLQLSDAGIYHCEVTSDIVTGLTIKRNEITLNITNVSNPLDDFVTTWKTTNLNESITIPTFPTETYNYTVDWGDGSTDNTIYTGDATHPYTTAGEYEIRISNTFPRIYFNNAGDKDKIISIDQWGNQPWTSMASAFKGCANLAGQASDNPILSGVTDLSSMFAGCSVFNQDISGWKVDNITNMSAMFASASFFNKELNWDTSKVTSMLNMFSQAKAFSKDLDWNTSEVTTMSGMFNGAEAFNGNISNWITTKVTGMSYMFSFAKAFDKDITGWTTNNVTNMFAMFWNAEKFNQPIGIWKTSKVTEMSFMFKGAINFDQNLENWNVEGLVVSSGTNGAEEMFANIKLSSANYDALLISWNSQILNPNVMFSGGNSTYCNGEIARTNMINNDGWTIIDGGKDAACITVPNCTTLTNPSNGVANVLITSDLTWTAVTNADGYYLSVGTSSRGTDFLNNENILGGATTTYNPLDFAENQTYYVTVIAYNTVGNAVSCTETSFTTEIVATVPDCTSLTSPVDGITGVSISTDLTWTAVTNADGYYLSVGTSSGGTDFLNNENILGGATTTYNPLDFAENQTYYVTVIAYNTVGNAVSCTETSFTTEDDLAPQTNDIPNFFTPNNDGTNDYWQVIDTDNQIEYIQIFDRYGKLLKQFTTTSQGWDGNYMGNPMPNSDYWYIITLNNGKYTKGHFSLIRR